MSSYSVFLNSYQMYFTYVVIWSFFFPFPAFTFLLEIVYNILVNEPLFHFLTTFNQLLFTVYYVSSFCYIYTSFQHYFLESWNCILFLHFLLLHLQAFSYFFFLPRTILVYILFPSASLLIFFSFRNYISPGERWGGQGFTPRPAVPPRTPPLPAFVSFPPSRASLSSSRSPPTYCMFRAFFTLSNYSFSPLLSSTCRSLFVPLAICLRFT